jgi:hypothetical protein
MRELEGLPLATFWQRLLGYFIDLFLAVILWAPLEVLWRVKVLHQQAVHVVWDFHEPGNILFALLYFGLFNFVGNGRTPGKWVARIRAVSLTGPRLGLWQSIERWAMEPPCSRAASASCSFSGATIACVRRIALQRPSSSTSAGEKRSAPWRPTADLRSSRPHIVACANEPAKARTFFVPAYPLIFAGPPLLPHPAPGIIGGNIRSGVPPQ